MIAEFLQHIIEGLPRNKDGMIDLVALKNMPTHITCNERWVDPRPEPTEIWLFNDGSELRVQCPYQITGAFRSRVRTKQEIGTRRGE